MFGRMYWSLLREEYIGVKVQMPGDHEQPGHFCASEPMEIMHPSHTNSILFVIFPNSDLLANEQDRNDALRDALHVVCSLQL